MTQQITEPARNIDVAGQYDICVIGGSCTGVFAAVRAARLGKSVCIVEKHNSFGGVATNGLVNVWHKLKDTVNEKQIIAGLTTEVLDRLAKRKASEPVGNDSVGFYLNTEELKIELDELVIENNITPMLHCLFVRPVISDGRIDAVIVEDKSGRRAVRASVFVDASGDGDLAHYCGMINSVSEHLQPPTTCAKILGLSHLEMNAMFQAHREEFGVDEDHGWVGKIPGSSDIGMYALTHCFGTNAADAESLSAAEIEGRRHIRVIMDIARKYGPDGTDPLLLSLPARIGVRETRRFGTRYILNEQDVLTGRSFEDSIAYGSYRVDVHHPDGGGFLFKYLDGTQVDCREGRSEHGRWRDVLPDGEPDPTFYQVPYRTMLSQDSAGGSLSNLLIAGRMIGTDRGACGAVRVMVNLNQVGEAAGVAASIAIDSNCCVDAVDPARLRKTMADGGSIMF